MMMMMWDIDDNNKMKYVLHLLTHDAHGCCKNRRHSVTRSYVISLVYVTEAGGRNVRFVYWTTDQRY